MQVSLTRRRPTPDSKAEPPSLRRWWLICGGTLAAAVLGLARSTYADPGAPWRGYQWLTAGILVGAAGWVLAAKQRKELWGDRAFRWWVWHWFTGAPLVVVNDRRLPWWQDVRKCWPFLDTTRAEACPEHREWRCVTQRAMVAAGRTWLVGGLIAAEYVRSGAPHGSAPLELAAWGLAGTAVLAAGVLLVARTAIAVARWSWWYYPLHMALYARVGHRADKRPRSWILIPRSFLAGGRAIRLKLPLDVVLSQDNKTKVQEQLLGVLGLDARQVDITWDPEGLKSGLYVRPAKRIPDTVRLSQPRVQRALAQTKGRWSYLVGFTAGWQRVVQSIEDQAPHILIAGPSKTGKSQLVKVILWQLLHKTRRLGKAQLWFLDIKGYSHDDDFEHRPGVTYCRTVDSIAEGLVDVMALATVRSAEFTAAKAAGRRLTFPPVFVVLEDAGAVIPKLPKPAVQAWDDILSLGRGVAIHAIALPHRPDQKYLGSGAVRDNLGNRILMSGHGSGAKKMLDDVDYEIPPQKRGRFVVLEGLHGTHTQGILDDLGLIAADLDDLLGPKPKALPADDLVLPLDDNAELGQVTPVVQPQPASDMQPLVPERLVARPPGQPVPGRTQPLSDIRGRLIITGHTGQPVNDRRGAHTTDPNTRQDGEQGETAGQAHQTHQGHRTSPRQGAAPSPPRAHVPAAGAAGRTVPEGPGVIGPEPQPHSALNDPSAAPGHPQSPSRLAVPVGEGGVGAGRGDGDAGDGDTLPVTLREGYDRGLVGDGVEYETVRKARRRTARVIRERFAGDVDAAAAAGWWFPAPCGIREVKPNGERVHEYDPPELDRWWRSRPRGEPDDGVWWVYFMVQGGIGNTRWGSVVKIGYTTDLEDRCRKFGNHFPGARALAAWVEAGMPAGGPGGDIVYLEAFRSRKEARAAESAYHRRWKREFRPVRLDDDPPVGPNTSLMCWPHGGGGNSGREQFWIEGTLAAFMADVCPRGRREAS